MQHFSRRLSGTDDTIFLVLGVPESCQHHNLDLNEAHLTHHDFSVLRNTRHHHAWGHFILQIIFIFRVEVREGEKGRETLIGCFAHGPRLCTEPTTQACAMTRFCRSTPSQATLVREGPGANLTAKATKNTNAKNVALDCKKYAIYSLNWKEKAERRGALLQLGMWA